MFITADQLLCHALGDYLIQSDWMASEKTKGHVPAAMHAVTYAIPFLLLANPSPLALAIIVATHFIIDRWRLARYVVWAKNFLGPRRSWYPWEECAATGYHSSRPIWLSTWLLIIGDNVLHVMCNGLAIKYWPA